MKKCLSLLILALWLATPNVRAQKRDSIILSLQSAAWDISGNLVASANGEEKALQTNEMSTQVSLDVKFLLNRAIFEPTRPDNRLPIMFKWFKFSSARLFIVNINQDTSNPQPKAERGQFVYHCRVTQNLTKGTWVVKPVYANNEPVLIDGQKCEFKITVQ